MILLAQGSFPNFKLHSAAEPDQERARTNPPMMEHHRQIPTTLMRPRPVATESVDGIAVAFVNIAGSTRGTLGKIRGIFEKTRSFFVGIAAFLKRAGLAIRDTALLLYRAARVCVVAVVVLGSTCVIVWLTYKILTWYQARRHLQTCQWSQHQTSIRFRQSQHRRADAESCRCRETEQEAEVLRRIAAEHARRVDEARIARDGAQAQDARQKQEAELLKRTAAEHARRADEARKAREEAQARDARQKQINREMKELFERQEISKLYGKWKSKCSSIFDADEGELPEPPSWSCSQAGCQQTRVLEACCHSIRRLFSAVEDDPKEIRQQRARWHPDRKFFHKTNEHSEKNHQIANEIFKALPDLKR